MAAIPRPVPRYALRPDEAAASLGVSLGTFKYWERQGFMPQPVKIGRICLYDAEAVHNAWKDLQAGASSLDVSNSWDG